MNIREYTRTYENIQTYENSISGRSSIHSWLKSVVEQHSVILLFSAVTQE